MAEAAGVGRRRRRACCAASAYERGDRRTEPRARSPRRRSAASTRRRARSCRRCMSRRRSCAIPTTRYSSGNIYGRPDNATVREAEAVIGALEGAAAALVFGSGMSAAIALFLSLPPGAHIVAPRVMYWGLRNWLADGGAAARPRSVVSARRRISTRSPRRSSRGAPSSSGWRRRAIRSGASATSPAPRALAHEAGASSASIPPARRRSSHGRSRSAPTSSCIRRPNISTAIPT